MSFLRRRLGCFCHMFPFTAEIALRNQWWFTKIWTDDFDFLHFELLRVNSLWCCGQIDTLLKSLIPGNGASHSPYWPGIHLIFRHLKRTILPRIWLIRMDLTDLFSFLISPTFDFNNFNFFIVFEIMLQVENFKIGLLRFLIEIETNVFIHFWWVDTWLRPNFHISCVLFGKSQLRLNSFVRNIKNNVSVQYDFIILNVFHA